MKPFTPLLLVFLPVMNLIAETPPAPDKSYVYKKVGDTELRLHVFFPGGHPPSEKKPGIVFFFGGGWNKGNPGQFFPFCEYLASRGMVAASAEYRVHSVHGTSPRECVKDGKSAVRWMRTHAEDLGIDPGRLAAGGGSAGGHVAAATGTDTAFEEEKEDPSVSCTPNALVLMNPVFDNGPGGFSHERVKGYWEEISPLHNLTENTPPTVVFLGTKDHLIPVSTAEKYKAEMEKTGGRCDLYLHEGQPHGFFNVAHKENYEKVVSQMDAFLTSLGYLEAEKE